MIGILVVIFCSVVTLESAPDDYLQQRNELLGIEKTMIIGSDISLTENEEKVNKYLMLHKEKELEDGFKNPENFIPGEYFSDKITQMEESLVFQLIQNLPKGGNLHFHEIAFASLDWVVNNLTHWNDLYVNITDDDFNFKWAQVKPEGPWKSVKDYRSEVGDDLADWTFLQVLNISSSAPFSNVNQAWEYLDMSIDKMLQLLSYAPAYECYLYQGLQEYLNDGIQYVEMRTIFPNDICQSLTCVDPMTITEVATLTKNTFERFKNDNPSFCGGKVIYTPIRNVDINIKGPKYVENIKDLRKEFPDFVVGFDLVQQEDLGHPLIDYIDMLLEMRGNEPDLKFFFHGGETLWNGAATDNNLVDAILLNTTRIGHGYAILKHPEVLRRVIEQNVAIEINPISNQMLGLVKDMRNHPGTILQNFIRVPFVISNDDSISLGAKGLSYDFYEAFMGFAPRNADLKILKQFRLNSIEYSSMNEDEKASCSNKIEEAWNKVMGYSAYHIQ